MGKRLTVLLAVTAVIQLISAGVLAYLLYLTSSEAVLDKTSVAYLLMYACMIVSWCTAISTIVALFMRGIHRRKNTER